MTARLLRLHPQDSVAIAVNDILAGTDLPEFGLTALERIPAGHKLALVPHDAGAVVRRYGQMIGLATAPIAAGAHIHSHNLGMGAHHQDPAFGVDARALPAIEAPRSFLGYHRADGRVGTRNYLGVLTSVNCSGSVARFIAEAAEKSGLLDEFPNVDGVVPIMHGTGCGMGPGAGYDVLHRTLQGYARNPNFGGILLVGLGCEVLQIPDLVGRGRMRSDNNFRSMTIQATGGTRRSVEMGLELLREMAVQANSASRQPAPVSHLTVALQCGGSDGYSGMTANPALGVMSDLLVRHGGTTILAETPEIYGAEHLLTRRAVSPEVGEKLLSRIRWWEEYVARNGGAMDNNPSPGNKRGGLTTILEKSLGAIAKGGTAPLVGVYDYAEQVTTPGFTFMDSPGYDPVSVTGQIASGATVVVFTTGRGSVSGFKPAPCLKLSTTSEMFARMDEDMDLDCGDILTRGVSIVDKGAELFDLVIATASGARTRSEDLGFGGAEFVPWLIGAVM
jgi:altronate dehydratase